VTDPPFAGVPIPGADLPNIEAVLVMSPTDRGRSPLAYKFACEDGRRYVVYNAAVLGNPPDHVPDKWYVRPYPVPPAPDGEAGGPFETVEEAERATRARCVPGR
jgi:hypothetical protein